MLAGWKYRPRNTLIQRFDPRARLIYMACVILAITLAEIWDFRFLMSLFIISLALYLLARIEWRDVWRAWVFILILVFFIIGLNALLSGRGGPDVVRRETSPVLFQLPILVLPSLGINIKLTITVVKTWFAITQVIRILAMAILAIPLPYTTDPSLYGVAFRQMGVSDKAAFTMDLAFRFLPTMARDLSITVDAQRARGYELESLRGGIISRLRRLAPLMIPVTMQSIVTGEEVIDAMDMRAFGARKRTWLRLLTYQRRDFLLIGFGVAILITSFVLRFLGYNEFWVPQFMYRLAG